LAKRSQYSEPTLLVIELWGLGDLALAIPFLRAASGTMPVTLVAQPHAGPLLERFAPSVTLLPFVAPWTAFRGKYRFLGWPWARMGSLVRNLRSKHITAGVSARPDPRDHALMAFAGAQRRFGFPRQGFPSRLTDPLPPPALLHRAAYWASLASAIGIQIPAPAPVPRYGKRILIHTGAAQPTRRWPLDRYGEIARRLARSGWTVEVVDDSLTGVGPLIDKLAAADRFIGNDSGPGHLAALLGVPTFTIFGPQLPELFAPRHPKSQWIDGGPCPYKPCSDYCRFAEPLCLNANDVESVYGRLTPWLEA
jgi:ADP-heptose:LPS heptosyltransferase